MAKTLPINSTGTNIARKMKIIETSRP
jgi:hypothetical protein